MYPGEHGRVTPNKPAVIMGSSGTVVTYAELDERSRRLSRLLHERGLVRGDMIALFAENHPRYFEVAWAALRSGMYLVTVNRLSAGRRSGVSHHRLGCEGVHLDDAAVEGCLRDA